AWPPPCGGRLRTRRPHIAGSARCACGASWTVYWGGLTALLACPGSGMSTAGHASPHDHAPSAFKAKPCFAPRRPGTPVSGELLALQRIIDKKGTPSAESLFLAGWVLVFTTLAPAVLSAQTIMALYRCRWQVEIAIKRWKSVLAIDALRAKANSPLAEVWLQGKLLYALMLERRMRRQLGDSWGRLDRERVGTWWRVWGMLKDEIGPMITGAF